MTSIVDGLAQDLVNEFKAMGYMDQNEKLDKMIQDVRNKLKDSKECNYILGSLKDDKLIQRVKNHIDLLKHPDSTYLYEEFKDRGISFYEIHKASGILQCEEILSDRFKDNALELGDFIYENVYLKTDADVSLPKLVDNICYAINDGKVELDDIYDASKWDLIDCALDNDFSKISNSLCR